MFNYHSHTFRCKHASGTEEEYIRQAIQSGFGLLGFSDHTPWPYENDFKPTYHMELHEFPGYRETVRALQEKYKGQIEIRLGLECEYFPAYINWLREFKEEQGLDYLILGNHFSPTDDGGQYQGSLNTPQLLKDGVKALIGGMETGLYMYVAHPDLVLRSYPAFDEHALWAAREICRASVALDVPLEYNMLGVLYAQAGHHPGLGYPCRAFWDVAAQEGVTGVIGVDAHKPEHLANLEGWRAANDLFDQLGIRRMSRRA